MRSILFPTDFSELSQGALRYALSFASDLRAQLTIMNVYHPTNSPRRPFIEEGTRRRQVLRELKNFVHKQYLNKVYRGIRFRVKAGSTIRRLLEAAKSYRYDLLVLRRSENYDWLTRLLGSKTSILCAKAECPVLVLPPKADFQSFHNVLFVYGEHEEEDRQTRAYLDYYAARSGRRIHYLPIIASDSIRKQETMPYQKVKSRIKAYIQQHKIDLLITALRPKRITERFLDVGYMNRLILELDVPVLVVNDKTIQGNEFSLIPNLSALNNKRA